MLSGCSRLISAATAPSFPRDSPGVSAAYAVLIPPAISTAAIIPAAVRRSIFFSLIFDFLPYVAAGLTRRSLHIPGDLPDESIIPEQPGRLNRRLLPFCNHFHAIKIRHSMGK